MSNHDPYILVGGGRKFYFLHPRAFKYDIHHIAGALSRLCRFTGHTSTFYSVAEHSVWCSHNVPEEFALEALLHDASEAYFGDMSSPLKSLFPGYCAMALETQLAIYDHFGVTTNGGEEKSIAVHAADMAALATEKRDLMPHDRRAWPCLIGVTPDPKRIWHGIPPKEAEDSFLSRFYALCDNPTQ